MMLVTISSRSFTRSPTRVELRREVSGFLAEFVGYSVAVVTGDSNTIGVVVDELAERNLLISNSGD